MKKFYTEKDIEDLFNHGTRSLRIGGDDALTELAYEQAKKLGLQLVTDEADTPPSAPMRPYLSEKRQPPSMQGADSLVPAVSGPQADGSHKAEVASRIRAAVGARLGNQIDAGLLDTIIRRVINATGVK